MGWGCPSVQMSKARAGLGLPFYNRMSMVARAGWVPSEKLHLWVLGSISLC